MDFDSDDEEPSGGYKRYVVVAFSVLLLCGLLGIAVTRTESDSKASDTAAATPKPGTASVPVAAKPAAVVGNPWRFLPYQEETDSPDELKMQAKPANEAWSNDFEPALQKITLDDGSTYDPFKVPPLFSQGCEDTPGWTNGVDCNKKGFLIKVDAKNATYCKTGKKGGFTCAAYAAGGWCRESWAVGPFSNYPEKNCCSCGGGTSVMQLTADCGKASEKCAKAVQYAKYVGIRKHPEKYPGLSKMSTFDDVQKFLHEKEIDKSQCAMPCGAVGQGTQILGTAKSAGEVSSGSSLDHDVATCPKRHSQTYLHAKHRWSSSTSWHVTIVTRRSSWYDSNRTLSFLWKADSDGDLQDKMQSSFSG